MKTRTVIIIIGVVAIVALWFLIPSPDEVIEDRDRRLRDSLSIEEQFKSRLAQEKVKWADSVARFADDFEARILPPETIYQRNHEKALTADTTRMWIHMGQLPRDNSITN